MEICQLFKRDFKVVILKKLSEIQEKKYGQLNGLQIHEQNEKFNKEIEIIIKN